MNSTRLLCAALALVSPAAADIVWTGAVSGDIFDEGNWDLSGSTVTAVDPNVTIDDNVVIKDAPGPVMITDVSGQQRLQVGDGYTVTIDNSIVEAANNDGIGGPSGSGTGPFVLVINGGQCNPFFIVNRVRLDVTAGCSASLAGPNVPVNNATINLTQGATLYFPGETPADYITEHLSKTTVDNVAAVVDGNIRVKDDGAVGSVVRALGPVGTGYCSPANVNSTGSPAIASGWGLPTAADNDFALTSSSMPANELGYFLCSQATGFLANPGGSQGNLCLGGKIGRPVGGLLNSGGAGEFTVVVDLTSLPMSPNQPALSGETWHFQAWFQDGSTSNFTEGLSVTFD